ncbi:hypothetical protein N5T96_06800 [Aliarcobacter butzleri]|uniref:hypothetical protein n=1 Tax=Aliarcobacter butzleri TaxID=28197 RepID=UPI0021B1A259|nr:hypothetical protein [Aliarcobacter butzleri]MCT7566046.1 hypothetical protein [Aliarcobacter butzleri]MCT7573396.1 hypothetical protein [Aliarcobacter butzleri]
MENFDKNIIITGVILSSLVYLFYRSLFKFKKLTNFQQKNRWQIINQQGYILVGLLAFSYLYDYILRAFLYDIFINLNLIQSDINIDMFISFGFGIVAIVVLFINFKFNTYINSKDERVVNIEQESTFSNFTPVAKKVKTIKYYSHFFNGLTLERSPKDYTIQSVKLNFDLNSVQKYKIEMVEKDIKINDFYKRLIDYLNLKSKTFRYKKIEKFEIEQCNNMLELKILIFERFKNLTNKQYFASISQLFQISNLDETEFLSFLRDSQHHKFSTTSLKHAILFLNIGVLK